jgi:hypothetical protein
MHFSARSHPGVGLSIFVFFFVQHVVDHIQGALKPVVCANHALIRLPVLGIPYSQGSLQLGLAQLDPVDQLINHSTSLRPTSRPMAFY